MSKEEARVKDAIARGICPDCGNLDDHVHPDEETAGRCRDCCPMCQEATCAQCGATDFQGLSCPECERVREAEA